MCKRSWRTYDLSYATLCRIQFFYLVNEKIVEFMGPTIVEIFDMFILFGLCNFSSRSRTIGIIDMMRVLIQNLV